MIKEWYTARELAELNINGMPKTQQGIFSRSERESWKSRDRNASGGGREYHISNLPDEAQINLIDSLIGKECTSSEYFGHRA